MAKTAVYAHFNAAVELEYMRKWSRAKEGFETAQKLAQQTILKMDPIHDKIFRALAKV